MFKKTSINIPNELLQEVNKYVDYSNPERKDRTKLILLALKDWVEKQKEAA